MHISRPESVPELRRDGMSDRIGVVVKHQLGHLAGSGSEQHQHRIAGFAAERERIHHAVTRKRGRIADLLKVGDPAAALLTADKNAFAQRRTVVENLIDLFRILWIGNHHFEAPELDALTDVVRRQKNRGRALNRTEFDQRKREDPPFRNARQKQKDTVAAGNAVFDQKIRRLIGEFGKVVKREFLLVAMLVHPDQRKAVAVLIPDFIHNIKGKIIIFRRSQWILSIQKGFTAGFLHFYLGLFFRIHNRTTFRHF